MAKTITIIRHAETHANREGRWQGSSDSGISDLGHAQLDRLAARFSGTSPDVVIASDLPRTMATAAVLGDVVPDRGFREFSIGSWEGLTSAEIANRFPEQWQAFADGEDLAPGGGEQMSQFVKRVGAAFDDLASRLADGAHAVVVTHGGVILALLSQIAGFRGTGHITPAHNTSVSQVTITETGERRLDVFNDATHLDGDQKPWRATGQQATFVRHGQSEGNVAGTWDSTTDTPLTDLGKQQAKSAAVHAPVVEAMFSSPRIRTTQTAEIIGAGMGTKPTTDEGLVEMFFGAWEGLTTAQILEQHASDLAEYQSGNGDETPRGGHGESLVGAGIRMRRTAERLAGLAMAEPYIAVSHGAAIRALAVNVLGIKNAGRGKITMPRNSAQSSFVLNDDRIVMASYNVAPHLD